MSSQIRKAQLSKDQRDCERRCRDIEGLIGRNPTAWVPIGGDKINMGAVELLRARGVLELDEHGTQFRLRRQAA